jgi:hypothetical protein
MIKEPIIVFTKNAAKGRELADGKNWYFCDGSASIAATTAKAFRDGGKNGIVITYPFAAMGMSLDRPGSTVILTGNPSIAEGYQATRTAGMPDNCYDKIYSFNSIDQLRLRLSKHKCYCLIQVISLRGCQCGGI